MTSASIAPVSHATLTQATSSALRQTLATAAEAARSTIKVASLGDAADAQKMLTHLSAVRASIDDPRGGFARYFDSVDSLWSDRSGSSTYNTINLAEGLILGQALATGSGDAALLVLRKEFIRTAAEARLPGLSFASNRQVVLVAATAAMLPKGEARDRVARDFESLRSDLSGFSARWHRLASTVVFAAQAVDEELRK